MGAPQSGNGLALLANKCASRTFDISSGMVYASIRDQIVRAQLLIRDLKHKEPTCSRLLIVGAGVAGLTAAATASHLGIRALVIEREDAPLSRQAGVHRRLVGPFMYEWPSCVSTSQDYPDMQVGLGHAIKGTPTWQSKDPLPASALVTAMRTWWNSHLFPSNQPAFCFSSPSAPTREYINRFVGLSSMNSAVENSHFIAPTFQPHSKPTLIDGQPHLSTWKTFRPDYVILAVGMENECVELLKGAPAALRGTPFWDNDNLRDVKRAEEDIAVFGGGDGALQDTLRLLTTHDHPLDFVGQLHKYAKAEMLAVLPELDALEQQSRLVATWAGGAVYDLIDEKCQDLCEKLARNTTVKSTVHAQLRKGKGCVHHVYRDSRFGRAYLLNRFAVHLLKACGTAEASVRYEAYPAREAKTITKLTLPFEIIIGAAQDGKSDFPLKNIHGIVVRFGPSCEVTGDRQLIKLRPATRADRMSMSAIPLPFTVAS